MEISITICAKNGEIRQGKNDYEDFAQPLTATAQNLCVLATQELSYQAGDFIQVKLEEKEQYLVVQLEETLSQTLVYVREKTWNYPIPIAENEVEAQVDTAFSSKRHCLYVRVAEDFEIARYQNLALNTHDQKEENTLYPHASANVETRNDATFFAKNVIDGKFANQLHGSYPYQSWGINQQKDACLKINFGRTVTINQIRLLFRVDFPHDSYWESLTLVFDDESKEILQTEKTAAFQVFHFPKKKTRFILLKDLVKASDTSPFPALTQVEVYGWNGGSKEQ